jgi:elongation factor G
MGELHLEIILDRLLREFRVDANIGKPQVAYRRRSASGSRTSRAVSCADRWSRPVRSRVINAEYERRGGYEFRELDRRRVIPASTSRAWTRYPGALDNGVVAGFRSWTVKFELSDGRINDVTRSEMAFQIAGSMAAKEPLSRANRSFWSR